MKKSPKQCFNCGKFISMESGHYVEFDVSEEFRKERPDVPAKTRLCGTCGEDSEILERYKNTPWYAGHRVF
jgi:hypothetical protein